MDKDDLKIGMVVDYHSCIGGPITKSNCIVESKPWQLGHGQWIVSISGMSGGVSLDALTKKVEIKPRCDSCLCYEDNVGCYYNQKIIKNKCQYFC